MREPEEDPKVSSNKEQESDHCDRLFTFMDEKEVEKKIIRDYIFKNTKNKPTNLNMNRDRDSHKAKKSEAIVKMVEGSRQKHERTLIKISPNTSIGKLNRISRSRTPKHLSFIESKL